MSASRFTYLAGLAALAMLAGVVSTAPAQPPPPGLQYLFVAGTDDPTKPGGIADASGNGHNGTVITATDAEIGMIAGPSGNNMNNIHIDYDPEPDETSGSGINTGVMNNDPTINIFDGPYTVMAWVNLDDETPNIDHMVFGSPLPNAPGSGEPRAGALHLGFRGTLAYNGWWGASVNRDTNSPYVGQVGEWHHVAWRFDGMDSGGNQDIFQDGALTQDHATPSWYGGILAENNNVPNVPTVLLIGRSVAGNGTGLVAGANPPQVTGPSGAFAGYLADVRVYPVALSDDDIAAIYASPP
jgi:hypothetical protein